MTDVIQVSARFPNVTRGNRADFKRLATAMLDISTREPGVLQYDWFFNEPETVCVVLETYQDAQALLAHIANLGERFGELVELGGGCDLEFFGNFSPSGNAAPGVRRSVFRTRFLGKQQPPSKIGGTSWTRRLPRAHRGHVI